MTSDPPTPAGNRRFPLPLLVFFFIQKGNPDGPEKRPPRIKPLRGPGCLSLGLSWSQPGGGDPPSPGHPALAVHVSSSANLRPPPQGSLLPSLPPLPSQPPRHDPGSLGRRGPGTRWPPGAPGSPPHSPGRPLLALRAARILAARSPPQFSSLRRPGTPVSRARWTDFGGEAGGAPRGLGAAGPLGSPWVSSGLLGSPRSALSCSASSSL